uniref:Uncharacterized protein n=1 Tax=Anguilla anguilla TaxID=7936 RepID=A0A0E9QXB1_ANGAN
MVHWKYHLVCAPLPVFVNLKCVWDVSGCGTLLGRGECSYSARSLRSDFNRVFVAS